MIDIQLINNALLVIAIACGAAVFLAISTIVVAAVWGRRDGTRHGRRSARPQPAQAAPAREPALR
jgi:hypothetical protein